MDQYLVIGPDGKEFGPIDLAGLQQWIREGRVLKQTRVRKNDGAAVAAESLPEVAEVFAPPPSQANTPPIATTVPILPEFKSWEFIGQAWELVKPHWVQLSVMFLILGVIGAIPYVGPCISFLIGTTLLVGINRAVLGLMAGRPPSVEMMFSGFDRFGHAFASGVVITILVSIAMALPVVPGILLVIAWHAFDSVPLGILASIALAVLLVPAIYLGIMWSFTNLVIAETKQDFWSAMQTSVALTKGYRWSVFCLSLAMAVIGILGLLVCCIGVFVAQAVGAVAFALAYRFLQSKQAAPGVA
jgi:Protein of unknown function (DUF975)